MVISYACFLFTLFSGLFLFGLCCMSIFRVTGGVLGQVRGGVRGGRLGPLISIGIWGILGFLSLVNISIFIITIVQCLICAA